MIIYFLFDQVLNQEDINYNEEKSILILEIKIEESILIPIVNTNRPCRHQCKSPLEEDCIYSVGNKIIVSQY